jgi:thiazolinyl imide reductase
VTAPRIVVCGTTFGQVYLKGVHRGGHSLAGILSRGSEASQRQADRWRVPLYTSVADLPSDVDVACVVVRSGVLGGRGTELAVELLQRGIDVVQEQPVHSAEAARCLRIRGARYLLNSFYAHLAPVRTFLRLARALLARRRPLFVDAACGIQVSYPLIDILGRALGGLRPWSFAAAADEGAVFRSVHGRLAGIPLTLRVQNQLDPADPDNHAHLLHRVSIGTDGGVLTLADTHGPVLWSPRLHVPRDPGGALILDGDRVDSTVGATEVVTPGPPASFRQLLDEVWPDAAAAAIGELRGTPPHPQHQLTTCRVWEDLGRALGHPETIEAPAPRPLSARELVTS